MVLDARTLRMNCFTGTVSEHFGTVRCRQHTRAHDGRTPLEVLLQLCSESPHLGFTGFIVDARRSGHPIDVRPYSV
jgi:hypothetical protein